MLYNALEHQWFSTRSVFTWPVINSLPTSWVEWLIIFYQTINSWKIWLVIIESPLWALRYCGWWTIRCSGSTGTSRTSTKVFPIKSIKVPILVFITNMGATTKLWRRTRHVPNDRFLLLFLPQSLHHRVSWVNGDWVLCTVNGESTKGVCF